LVVGGVVGWAVAEREAEVAMDVDRAAPDTFIVGRM
jgi:hypothetical protein